MLAVKNLKTGYNGTTVVSLASLEVNPGGHCLIRGASGSGKTTLLYALAGLGEIQGGTVSIDGADIYGFAESARDRLRGEKIGIIFQELNLVKSLTVLDNVLLGPFVNGRVQNMTRASELLARLGIAGFADRPAAILSRGQAQRVAIARALLNNPKLLLADEPTSSLDDAAAEQVMSILAELSAETGAALVVSTHDARITDRFDQVVNVGAA